ncbi:FAD-dependent monooxygenase [Kutzneria sp. NPDC052558]|uniref:FAD-dependent monooxygenase n=1 Tax=Kutzneria sp. NPDC052558 TaxID=3364121 RepID=UPI0037C5AAD8
MNDLRTPVLVVGAGPSGLTVANELRRHGVQVRIIDRAPAPAATSRALVVQPRVLEIFEDMGVVDEVLATGNAATSLNILFRADERFRMQLHDLLQDPANFTRYQSLWTLSQDDTERILTKHLATQGVRVERGLAVTDLVSDEDGVTVSVRTDDGVVDKIRSRWVIGCDGAHSTVRQAAGIPFEGSTYQDEFIMADAELDWELPDGDLYVSPSRSGFVAVFGMPGTHRFRIFGNVIVGPEGPSAEYSEPTHEEFQAMLDSRLPVPATVVKEHWVSRYRLHRKAVPRYRDGQIILVGDAAHVHSPAGAQGMNTGIQDAYNLAWKLALAIRGIADESIVDSYHAERHPVGERLLATTDRFFTIISGQNAASKFMRTHVAPRLLTRILGRKSFRSWFIGTLAQLRTSYPDSPLNRQRGSDWKDAPAPGDRARQVDVLIDGTPTPLHNLMHGTHHTVLLFTGVDNKARSAVELCRIAERIEWAYPDLVRAHVVSAERFADHPCAVGDPDRAAHKQYGIDRAAAFVVRPDLHIGYRGAPAEDELLADLVQRLPGAHSSAGNTMGLNR